MKPTISSVRILRARPKERRQGLIGWVSFVLDDALLVDNLALRRSRDGDLVFAWPARKDRAGDLHHHIRPIGDRERDLIEGQLLAHLFPLLRGGAA